MNEPARSYQPPPGASSWRRLVAVGFSVALAACGPIVRAAPFSARPDTARPGQLTGPFDGQVLDRESGQPVVGARVVASWGFYRGLGLRAPAGTVVVDTVTDADGRYFVDRVDRVGQPIPSGPSLELGSFTLLVVAPGRRPWRSDVALPDEGPPRRRLRFAQSGQRVELTAPRAGESALRQLAYLGVWGDPGGLGDAVVRAAEAARHEARPTAPVALVGARAWLTPEDLRELCGAAGPFVAGELATPPAGAADTVHLRAADRPERFDAALRVWSGVAAGARYQAFLTEMPGAAARDEVGDASFRAAEGEILAVGFHLRAPALTVLVTCGKGLCADHDVAVRVARRVAERAAAAPESGAGE